MRLLTCVMGFRVPQGYSRVTQEGPATRKSKSQGCHKKPGSAVIRGEREDLVSVSDENLMLAYANGDMEAFAVLYQRHKGRILGYLVSRLRDRDEAEEVFQVAFAKLHRARKKYRQDIPFLPWMFTITRNALVDHVRKRKVYRQHVTTSEEMVAAAADLRDREPLAGQLAADLAGLSATQRQALELRYFQELSFAEIADQLQTSAVNARQLVSRAIRSLREFMLGKGIDHENR
jgi:RNA polymerase sigma factor (sigma-70 family)